MNYLKLNWVKNNQELPKPNKLVYIRRVLNGKPIEALYLGMRNKNTRTNNEDPSKDCYWSGVKIENGLTSDSFGNFRFTTYFSDLTVLEWAYLTV